MASNASAAGGVDVTRATYAIRADHFVLPGRVCDGGYLTVYEGRFGLWTPDIPKGMDLVDYLNTLYAEHGCFAAKVQSIELQGITANEVSKAFMSSIRENTPAEIAGCKVTATVDYLSGLRKCLACGKTEPTGLPSSNVFTLELGEQGKIIVRPSGTEPKIKLYYTAIGKTWDEANALLAALQDAMKGFLPA